MPPYSFSTYYSQILSHHLQNFIHRHPLNNHLAIITSSEIVTLFPAMHVLSSLTGLSLPENSSPQQSFKLLLFILLL